MSELIDTPGMGTSFDDPSGARRAQEAHDAGAVLPTVEHPNHYATIHLVVHGPLEEAHELVTAVANKLAGHPAVTSVDYGITEPST